jgi:hypothetical protein
LKSTELAQICGHEGNSFDGRTFDGEGLEAMVSFLLKWGQLAAPLHGIRL